MLLMTQFMVQSHQVLDFYLKLSVKFGSKFIIWNIKVNHEVSCYGRKGICIHTKMCFCISVFLCIHLNFQILWNFLGVWKRFRDTAKIRNSLLWWSIFRMPWNIRYLCRRTSSNHCREFLNITCCSK